MEGIDEDTCFCRDTSASSHLEAAQVMIEQQSLISPVLQVYLILLQISQMETTEQTGELSD